MKCPTFRTAEDYRDHLPCEACEPTKALGTEENLKAHIFASMQRYKTILKRLREHRAEMMSRIEATDAMIADGEKMIAEMEAKYNVI